MFKTLKNEKQNFFVILILILLISGCAELMCRNNYAGKVFYENETLGGNMVAGKYFKNCIYTDYTCNSYEYNCDWYKLNSD